MSDAKLGVTRALARFVVESRHGALPPALWHEGERAFVNWLGCVFGGCRMDSIATAVRLLSAFSGPRQATAIGYAGKLDIFGAAFINSMSNGALAFNDTHLKTLAHPTMPVAAALLAMAERQPVSGAAFLHAMILGNEVQCRVGNILMVPSAQCHLAASMTGLTGGIGAAVAVTKLLGLDERRMIYAIGLAAAQAGGTRAAHGSSGQRLVCGEAARAGLMSALLAEQGFDTPDEAFSGGKGFANAHAVNADAEIAVAGLGEDWEFQSNSYKPYPCGIVIHPAIDVCLDLARGHRFDPDEIEGVVLYIPEAAAALTGGRAPRDGDEAGVSLYHWAAASLVHGSAGVGEGATDCVRDARVIAVRERINATVDPDLTADAARAELRLRDGRVLRASVAHARGSEARPMSDADLSEKFLGQAELVLERGAARDMLERAWSLSRAADVVEALGPLFAIG